MAPRTSSHFRFPLRIARYSVQAKVGGVGIEEDEADVDCSGCVEYMFFLRIIHGVLDRTRPCVRLGVLILLKACMVKIKLVTSTQHRNIPRVESTHSAFKTMIASK
jgi:hypothetical protein